MFDLFELSAETWQWIAILSGIFFLGSMLAIPLLLALIPENYFLEHDDYLIHWKRSHPILRYFVLVLRNLIGLILIVTGIVMLVAPGQGIITILLGLACSTFPGKRTLELRLLRQEKVSESICWTRGKFNQPPLKLPEEAKPPSE